MQRPLYNYLVELKQNRCCLLHIFTTSSTTGGYYALYYYQVRYWRHKYREVPSILWTCYQQCTSTHNKV